MSKQSEKSEEKPTPKKETESTLHLDDHGLPFVQPHRARAKAAREGRK